METFGQYAATRPLREHPLAPSASPGKTSPGNTSPPGAASANVLVQDGMIRTFMGVDLITGMPVIVYTLSGPAPRLPEVYSEHLPAILERGQRDGTGYLILASAPGYAPLKPTLPEPRLHWLARSSARALADAHAANLIHSHLRPEHFYAQGDHLFIEGFGLPWSDEPGVYRAPEGSGQAPADVYAWARCMNTFASNDPESLQDGELGHLIGHCLNAKSRERPTASELVLALEQILSPKAAATAAPIALAVPETTAENPATGSGSPRTLIVQQPEPASQTQLVIEPALNATPEVVAPEPEAVSLQTLSTQADTTHTLPVPVGLEADEPDVVVPATRGGTDRIAGQGQSTEATAASVSTWRDDDVLSTRVDEPSEDIPSAIRIGWQDDDSWRTVRAPTPVEPSAPPLLVWVLGGLLTVALLTGLVWFLVTATTETPASPTASPPIQTDRYVVNFRLDPASSRGGRLTVIEAPPGSGYAVGQVLSSVPGPVLFTKPGTYKLRVSVDGYQSTETILDVPGSNTVILKLK